MNEEEFARRLAGHLSASVRNLDEGVAERLKAARERAIEARRPAGVTGWKRRLLARIDVTALLRPLAVSVAILAAVVVGNHWANWVRADALQDVDMALLIDDLPIDAYLDADFKEWVQQEPRS